MLDKLEGCIFTPELSRWEDKFIADLVDLIDAEPNRAFTATQVEKVRRIYDRIFA